MGGLLRYWTPACRHSQVPAISPAREAAAGAASSAASGPARYAASNPTNLRCFMAVSCLTSPAFRERYPFPVLGAGVDGGGADDFTVDSLLDDMRGPPRGARDDENRGEHRGGHAHHVIRHRTIPVQVGEHLLLAPHHLLETLGDVEELHVAGALREPAGDFLDDLVARVARG